MTTKPKNILQQFMLVDLIKGSANRLSYFSYAFSIHTIYSSTEKQLQAI